MTVTPTANRIVNYSAMLLICACLAMLAVNFIISTPARDERAQDTGKATAKSIATAKRDSAQTAGNNNLKSVTVVTQKNAGAESNAKSASSKSIEETLVSDADRLALEIYCNKLLYDQFYRDIHKILGLDDATSEALRDLLASRIFAIDKALKDRSDKNMSSVDIAKAVASEYNEKIAALLGEEKYALFSEFEATLPQREQIRQFRNQLEFSGEPLSTEQEIALLPAIEKYLSEHPVEAKIDADWARMDVMRGLLAIHLSEENQMIFKDVLTPGQLEILSDNQKRLLKLVSINSTLRDLGLF